jgi:ABC-type branched-subunit amino acid transport system permease subunit
MPVDPAVIVSICADSVAAFLLLSALCHVFFQRQVGSWLAKPAVVRFIGAFLVLVALPCLRWRGLYFWTLFVALAISGLWRFFFPQHSINAQEKS